ncbi:MAG: hemolysin family protein [Pyrinomonadaceae bacterium]
MDEPARYLFIFIFSEAALPETVTLTEASLKLLAVLLLVLANGFFVGSEYALVTARRPKIEERAANGSRGARAALRLLADPTTFISATQLGVTLASLALGWIGEPTIAALLLPVAARIANTGWAGYIAHLSAIAIAFTMITFLHIVIGELMPKMMALERSESLAIISAGLLELFSKVFRAPIWVLNRTGAALGRLFGLKSSLEHTAVYTETELKQLVDISRASGHLRADEQRLIHSVFRFSDTLVREAMIPRTEMAAVSSTCSMEEMAKAFHKYGYSRLPVYRESLDDVAGFVHSKDVMPYLLHPETFRLEDVLQAPLYVVDTARLEDVMRQMQRAKSHFGFVVDEHGGVEGIITLEDLLEEIVGDISDEHDEEVNEQISKERDGTYLLDGGLAVRDLNRRLHLSVPESEAYTTIAGFLMTEAGHVLEPGEIVRHDGQIFHVEAVERRRVRRVRLEKAEAAPETTEKTNGTGGATS